MYEKYNQYHPVVYFHALRFDLAVLTVYNNVRIKKKEDYHG